MLCSEITTVCSENQKEHTNTPLNVKPGGTCSNQ